MALLNSRALKRDARPPMSGKIATKDIVRENALGQTVLVVAAGQPIPEGFRTREDEAEEAKKAPHVLNKAAEGRPTPKSARKKG
jgi:hypothetical protein